MILIPAAGFFRSLVDDFRRYMTDPLCDWADSTATAVCDLDRSVGKLASSFREIDKRLSDLEARLGPLPNTPVPGTYLSPEQARVQAEAVPMLKQRIKSLEGAVVSMRESGLDRTRKLLQAERRIHELEQIIREANVGAPEPGGACALPAGEQLQQEKRESGDFRSP